jgi:hypothetical protein
VKCSQRGVVRLFSIWGKGSEEVMADGKISLEFDVPHGFLIFSPSAEWLFIMFPICFTSFH